jgi:pimeloyl-ACP methyl ester carboxylesterase
MSDPVPTATVSRGLFRGGSGPPLVLIHAGWTSSRLWTPVLPALTEQRDVLAPTLPGHHGGPAMPSGATSFANVVDAVEREMDEAGFERPDVVGNSIGGIAALELARRGRARRVVAICPMGMQTDEQARAIERRFAIKHRAARATSRAALAALAAPAVRRVLLRDMAVRGDRVPTRLARHLVHAFASCDVQELFEATRLPDGTLPRLEHPEQIDVPVLLIWGDGDTIATRDQMDRYRTQLPNVQYLELAGTGHCPQLEVPDRIADAILTFTG